MAKKTVHDFIKYGILYKWQYKFCNQFLLSTNKNYCLQITTSLIVGYQTTDILGEIYAIILLTFTTFTAYNLLCN